jgi:tetratricopeptide (TPR) repeat protein
MRLVRGRTLTDAVRELHKRQAEGRAGPLEQRGVLQAFVTLCRTVAFAHAQGVIHRDLKGANVLLGPYGEVQVLDWGLARLLPQAVPAGAAPALLVSTRDEHLATVPGQVIGTPGCMAPEQAEGRLDLLDVRTDVYGLGAILYEILTSRLPYTGSSTEEVLQKLRGGPPPAPRAVAPAVPRALEAVCLKALARDPAQRYTSALALAEDVERWLAGEPVAARPEGWPERLARQLGVGRSASPWVAVATLVFVLLFLVLWRGAARDRDRFQREARGAEERARAHLQLARESVDRFHTAVSESTELKARGMEQIRTRLLESAAEFYDRLAKEESGERGVQAERGRAHRRLADLLQQTGQLARAEQAAGEAVTVAEHLSQTAPEDRELHADLAAALHRRGALSEWLGRFTAAEEDYTRAVSLRRELSAVGPEALHDLVKSLVNLAMLARELGRLSETERILIEARELCERAGEPADPAERRLLRGALYLDLGSVASARWREEEAIRYTEQARDAVKELGPDQGSFVERELLAVGILVNLSHIGRRAGRYDAALQTAREALAKAERLAADHPTLLRLRESLVIAANNAAELLLQLGQAQPARQALDRALQAADRLAEEQPRVPRFVLHQGMVHSQRFVLFHDTGQTEAADLAARFGRDLAQKVAAAHPELPRAQEQLAGHHNNLGNVFADTQRTALAAGAYQTALNLRKELAARLAEDPRHQAELALSHYNLGRIYEATDRLEQSRRAHEEALTLRRRLLEQFPRLPATRDWVAISQLALALVQFRQKRLDDSDRNALEAERTYRALTKEYPGVPGYAVRLASALDRRARIAFVREQWDDGLAACSEALTLVQEVLRVFPSSEARQVGYGGRLTQGRILYRLGRFAEALEAYNQALTLASPAQQFEARVERAPVVGRAGRHAEALAEVRDLRDRSGDLTGAQCWLLAVGFASAAEAAAKDAKLPEAERRRLAETAAPEAVALLRRAADKGYFDTAEEVRSLRAQPELNFLREREDFRKLLERVEKK